MHRYGHLSPLGPCWPDPWPGELVVLGRPTTICSCDTKWVVTLCPRDFYTCLCEAEDVVPTQLAYPRGKEREGEKQVNIRVGGSWWLAYPRAKERGGEKRSSQYKSQRELVQVRYRRLRVVLGFERNGPLYIVIVVGLSGRHLLLPGWGSTLCLESSPSKGRPPGRG